MASESKKKINKPLLWAAGIAGVGAVVGLTVLAVKKNKEKRKGITLILTQLSPPPQ
jgi:hypothetical protein